MSDWQRIETSKRERGLPVLVWDGHFITVAIPFGEKNWMVANSYGFNEDGEIFNVTHWRPLPSPPIEK